MPSTAVDSGNPLTYSWVLQKYNYIEKNYEDSEIRSSTSTFGYLVDRLDLTKYSKYRVRLSITDTMGTTDTVVSSEWVTNTFPTASISGDAKIYTNLNYIFNGSGSSAEDADQTLKYSWDVERFATTWSSVSSGFTGASTAALTINVPDPGTFRAILTVGDGYDTNSSIHLFDIFKPPEIDSFNDRPDAPMLNRDDRITIRPNILSEGIITDTETLGYFWQLEAYTGARWNVFNHSDDHLNDGSTGSGSTYMYEIIAPPGVYNSYCSKLRVKLTITDSNGTTDEYYSTEWNI